MKSQSANVPTALTANAFSRLGYSFNGWNTVAGGGGDAYADGATYDFAADVTLYAQWAALPNHTVTFDANGGTGTMSPPTSPIFSMHSDNQCLQPIRIFFQRLEHGCRWWR